MLVTSRIGPIACDWCFVKDNWASPSLPPARKASLGDQMVGLSLWSFQESCADGFCPHGWPKYQIVSLSCLLQTICLLLLISPLLSFLCDPSLITSSQQMIKLLLSLIAESEPVTKWCVCWGSKDRHPHALRPSSSTLTGCSYTACVDLSVFSWFYDISI